MSGFFAATGMLVLPIHSKSGLAKLESIQAFIFEKTLLTTGWLPGNISVGINASLSLKVVKNTDLESHPRLNLPCIWPIQSFCSSASLVPLCIRTQWITKGSWEKHNLFGCSSPAHTVSCWAISLNIAFSIFQLSLWFGEYTPVFLRLLGSYTQHKGLHVFFSSFFSSLDF